MVVPFLGSHFVVLARAKVSRSTPRGLCSCRFIHANAYRVVSCPTDGSCLFVLSCVGLRWDGRVAVALMAMDPFRSSCWCVCVCVVVGGGGGGDRVHSSFHPFVGVDGSLGFQTDVVGSFHTHAWFDPSTVATSRLRTKDVEHATPPWCACVCLSFPFHVFLPSLRSVHTPCIHGDRDG